MLAAAALAVAVAVAGAPETWAPEHEVIELASGLRVVLLPVRNRPAIAAVTVIGAGAAMDPTDRAGLAHVVEHLVLRTAPPGEVSPKQWMYERGCFTGGTTGVDLSAYTDICPRADAATLLGLVAARLDDPVAGLAEAGLAVEVEVVRNEKAERWGSGWNAALPDLAQMLYPEKHPYRDAVASTDRSLDQIRLPDAREWARAWFRPNNATVLLAGDFDLGEGRALVETELVPRLADGGERATRAQREAPPAPPEPGLRRVVAPGRGPQLVVGWTIPGAWGEDHGQTRGAAAALQAWLAARLGSRGRASRCLARPRVLSSELVCVVPLQRSGRARAVRRRVVAEAADLFATPAGAPILAATANRAQGATGRWDASAIDGLSRPILELIATGAHLTGRVEPPGGESGSWTGDSLAADLAPWVTVTRAAAVVVAPGRGEDAAEVADLVEPEAVASGAVDLPPLGDRGLLADHRDITLDNGLRVVVVPYGSAPVVRVVAIVPGYDAYAPQGMSSFAASRLRPGGAPRGEGIAYTPHLRDGAIHPGFEVAPAALDAALDALYGKLTGWEPVPPRELRSADRKLRRSVRRGRSPLGDEVRRFLYAETPDGYTLDRDAIRARRGWGLDDARAWVASRYQPANTTVVVVGPIDADAAEAAVRSAFTAWSGEAPVAPAPRTPMIRDPSEVVVLDAPNEQRARITLSCRVPDASVATWATRNLAVLAIKERVDALLRRTGLAYSPRVGTSLRGSGAVALSVDAQVPAEAVGVAVDALRWAVSEIEGGDRSRVAVHARAIGRSAVWRAFGVQQVAYLVSEALLTHGGDVAWLSELERLATETGSDEVGAWLSGCAAHHIVAIRGPLRAMREVLPTYRLVK